MATPPERSPYHDGRDEMNLADFPISALQRRQGSTADGRKIDHLEFQATRYDPVKRQRVAQKVTLLSSASDGLPTPADEHVILALLYVARHGDNFLSDTVFFAPGVLFEIMGWSPNGRSYARLRSVLRRLKSLTIRYDNAWWDAAGRGYEEEVATGIISGYRIARQVSGPRTPDKVPTSWVTWTQQFHTSLKNGNLKRLDLDVFFRLRTATAQRLYRFLDKRFYNHPEVALDLIELACGHIGLTEVDNVAILKRRLAPAIAELEEIGFLVPLPAEERFRKVKAGVWRVHFQSGAVPTHPAGNSADEGPEVRRLPTANASERGRVSAPSAPATDLAAEFYRLWDPVGGTPGPRDREQAVALLDTHGADEARELLPLLVQVTRQRWPECRSFSGAVQKYLGDAVKLLRERRRREAAREKARAQGQAERARQGDHLEEGQQLADRWAALSAQEQEAVRQAVLARLPGGSAPEAFVRRLCLEALRG
jgi:hypothetical protein